MSDISTKNIIRVSQSYIFVQLYNKGFIKSKSFNFVGSSSELQNKLMHIIKSTVNKELENNTCNSLAAASFKTSRLKIKVLMSNEFGKLNILGSRVSNAIQDARIGLQDVMMLRFDVSELIYEFDNLRYLVNPIANNKSNKNKDNNFSFKDNLDAIVNCIMYIPSSLKRFAAIVDEVSKIDENYQYSVKDIMDYTSGIFSYGSAADDIRSIGNEIIRLTSAYGSDNLKDVKINIDIDHKRNMHVISPTRYWYEKEGNEVLKHILSKLKEINGNT